MTMKNRLNTAAVALLLVTAASLRAQEKDGFVLSAALLSPHGDALDLTGQPLHGYGIQVGYLLTPEGYGVSILPYVGHQVLPGKEGFYKMSANVVGADLFYRIVGTALSISTGPSMHAWTVKQPDGELASTFHGDKKLKLGWRLSAEYQLSQAWSVSAGFTQTSWRSKTVDFEAYTPGLNPSRPAYWSFMANYRF